MVLPDSRRVSRALRYSGTSQESNQFRLQDCHLLWWSFPEPSAIDCLCNSSKDLQTFQRRPTTPRMQRLQAYTCAVWAVPRSLAATRRIAFAFFSCRYLDVSVPCVRFPLPIYSAEDAWNCSHAGCPIRRSPDQNLLAVPRSLSQLPTSFVTSRCLGIHRTPFVA
jgi:hypothetical protein